MKVGDWVLVAGMTLAVGLGVSTLRAASVIENWMNVKAPPAPELKPVRVDPKTMSSKSATQNVILTAHKGSPRSKSCSIEPAPTA